MPWSSGDSLNSTNLNRRGYGASGIYNVKEYGAVSDASTDDAAAIRSAIAAASAGGTVFLPAGIYRVNSPLTLSSDIVLEGSGHSSLLSLGANTNRGVISVSSANNVRITNLALVGNASVFTGTGNIGISGATGGYYNIAIDNVSIDSFAGDGISMLATAGGSRATNISIINCSIRSTGAHGIVCQDAVDNVRITNSDVQDWGLGVEDRIGIVIGRSASNQIVANNHIFSTNTGAQQGTSVHGISVDSTEKATIVGNTVNGCVGYGIECGFIHGGTIFGNVVYQPTRAGIALSGNGVKVNKFLAVNSNSILSGNNQGIYGFVTAASGTSHEDITINSNVVRGCRNIGIQLEHIKNFTCNDNVVSNCSLSGIYLTTHERGVVTGNRLSGNNTANNAAHGGLRILTTAADSTKSIMVRNNYVTDSNQHDRFYTEGGTLISERNIAGAATPSVALEDGYRITNASNTTITNFLDGHEGQIITLQFVDSNTTVKYTNNVIELSGAADFSPTADDTLTLRNIAGVWVEVSRTAI